MDRAAVLARCRGFSGSCEGFPFGDSTAVFKVGRKMFALVSLGGTPGGVSLKCDPGYAVALRERYTAVTAGYHLAKRHWNTVVLDGSVPGDALDEWIQESYELVLSSLSRSQRAAALVQQGEEARNALG